MISERQLNLKGVCRYFNRLLLSMVMTTLFSMPSFAFDSENVMKIKVDQTRIYINGDDRKGFFSIRNQGRVPVLLVPRVFSVAVDGGEGERSRDFLVSPAMATLGAGQQVTLSVVRLTNDLPKDRESLRYLKLHISPSKKTELDYGSLAGSMVLYANLFYRPEGLINPLAVNENCRKLIATVKGKGKTLELKNPTPYWLILSNISIGDVIFNHGDRVPRIAPFGKINIPAVTGSKMSIKCRQETGTVVEADVKIN